jgi:hypothetical protein
MEIRLKNIFDSVTDWLKFAEAKNAALIAVNSAIIFGFINIIQNNITLICWIRVYLLISIILLLLALSLSLISYIPQVNLPRILPKKISESKDNLFYYGPEFRLLNRWADD